jgi:hypothetical protein
MRMSLYIIVLKPQYNQQAWNQWWTLVIPWLQISASVFSKSGKKPEIVIKVKETIDEAFHSI